MPRPASIARVRWRICWRRQQSPGCLRRHPPFGGYRASTMPRKHGERPASVQAGGGLRGRIQPDRERIMTGDPDAGARQAPADVNKQFTKQEQRKDAAAKMNAWYHPFNWWDLLLFMTPIAIIALSMWWD